MRVHLHGLEWLLSTLFDASLLSTFEPPEMAALFFSPGCPVLGQARRTCRLKLVLQLCRKVTVDSAGRARDAHANTGRLEVPERLIPKIGNRFSAKDHAPSKCMG